MSLTETKNDLLDDLKIDPDEVFGVLEDLVSVDSKYVRDLRINLKNTLTSENLTLKETALIALSISANERNKALINSFKQIAETNGATEEEIAETFACTSLLSVNNVFYRFRHFTEKESYQQMPARIKMNIMMNPILGKEFFELMSLAISAVNGCEMCVKAHEASVISLGSTEARIFDAIRLASVVRGLSQVIN